MELFKKTLFHIATFTTLGLIYFAIMVDYYELGILSLLYFITVYVLVVLAYRFMSKKTKLLTKKRNKIILIVPTVIASIVLLGAILGSVDYIMARNGRPPLFTFIGYEYSKEEFSVENDDESHERFRFTADEYYGLGYKLVVCDSCKKEVYFMPLWIGTYTWSKGVPVDRLAGTWFHESNNDIYMSFDGTDKYSLSIYDGIAEEGTYTLDNVSVVLTPSKGDDIGNCTIENDYHQLHCDKYDVIFMR